MDYLHWEFDASSQNVVFVTLDKQANVRLLDSINYSRFRSGMSHQYHGGLAKVSPLRLPVPHGGHWHVVVDLGGFAGSVRASVQVV
jgi:hypothetical protein